MYKTEQHQNVFVDRKPATMFTLYEKRASNPPGLPPQTSWFHAGRFFAWGHNRDEHFCIQSYIAERDSEPADLYEDVSE